MKSEKGKLYLKRFLAIAIIAITFVLFGYYLAHNPNLIATLLSVSPLTILLLTVGYILVILASSFVLYHSLLFLGKRVSMSENILVTGYSSLVNFFGPLQSGSGFRAIYLKKKHQVRLRDFFATTLIFYGFFAAINVSILALAAMFHFGSLYLSIAIAIGIVILGAIAYLAIRRFEKVRRALTLIRLDNKHFWWIGLGAVAIALITAVIYYVEVSHVNSTPSALQVLVYTAAANLALFVSITPGAIGIRESFLVLSQQLHGIDTATIIGAGVIDRAFYVCFLLAVFLLILAVTGRKKLSMLRSKSGQ